MAGFRQILRDLLRSLGANETSWQRAIIASRIAGRQAEEQASRLLSDNLSAFQRKQYETRRVFDVTGGVAGSRCRIRRGHQLNVEELDQRGRRLRLLCFMPEGRVPVGDIMLAQKFALELFEIEALNVANRSPVFDDWLVDEMRVARRHG
jgi:hypothetical protein